MSPFVASIAYLSVITDRLLGHGPQQAETKRQAHACKWSACPNDKIVPEISFRVESASQGSPRSVALEFEAFA